MRVVDVLRKARALIVKGWTRKTFARDRGGREVPFTSRRACRFCADGALRRVTFGREGYAGAIYVLQNVIGGVFPPFNDAQKTKGPVLEAFDRAIKAVRRG